MMTTVAAEMNEKFVTHDNMLMKLQHDIQGVWGNPRTSEEDLVRLCRKHIESFGLFHEDAQDRDH